MNTPIAFRSIFGILLATLTLEANAQLLPGTLSFSVSGSFENGVGQGTSSILITDNDLTNGHAPGMDLYDSPAAMNPNGPAGSAAFQWGVAADWSSYAHTSALWFQPIDVVDVAANQFFNLGILHYRNGTIQSRTGAAAVDLALQLNFSNPSSLSPISTRFTNDLINTPNSSDPVASADIVSIRNPAAPMNFTDSSGNRYFLELSFKVDQTTIDGSLSTFDEFRVFEGGLGRADLLGRFTTSPIPEPSSAMLGVLGMMVLFRRKR
jgi:hypothetical protein